MHRRMGFSAFVVGLLSSVCLCSAAVVDFEDEVAMSEQFRKDSVPLEHVDEASDLFMEGYIQALIDMNYYEQRVRVSVRGHKVFLSHLPKNDLLADSIVAYVRDVPGIDEVVVRDRLPAMEVRERDKLIKRPQVKGSWFPQSTVLFPPLLAAPREPIYSAAYRYGDRIVGKHVAAVSVGDDFPIFRWKEVLKFKGDMQIGVAAGVWTVFNYHHAKSDSGDMCEMVNADYMLAIPLTYAFDQWAFRLRVYHISSHLGDELLVNHRHWLDKRKNASFEAVDFMASYQFSQGLRCYVGPGVVVHSDDSFKLKPLYVEWGAELRMFGKKLYYHRLYGTPFFAFHMENWQERKWDLDASYELGYEWSKLQGIGRKMRLFVGYHQGYSAEGQLFRERTRFGEVGLSWGF